jgi:hypothetical protein
VTFPPGWNSAEFVRVAHRDLEFISIVGFVVCAACEWIKHADPNHGKLIARLVVASFVIAAFVELIAFPYGERNDELARSQANKQDFAISELSAEAQEALGKTRKALDDSNTALAQAGAAVTKAASAVEDASSALTLASAARQELMAVGLDVRRRSPRQSLLKSADIGNDFRLRPFRGQRVLIEICQDDMTTESSVLDDPRVTERNDAALELAGALFTKAKWRTRIEGHGCRNRLPIDVAIDPLATSSTSWAATALSQAIHDALLYPNPAFVMNVPLMGFDFPVTTVLVMVGPTQPF